MITIGIRDLKARLSQVLREVQGGEVVLVTDRGRVVAEMRRPDGAPWTASPEERALSRLAAEGDLRVAERPSTYEISPLASPEGTAKALIEEERGES